ncbi:rsph10b, partial [Symbiodinium necroappetens]
RTHGGRTWLQAHKLPVPERRPKPPREGHGMYKFANGDEYHGQFRRGMREGAGVYTSKRSHMQYDGQWLRDRRHGTGTLTIESAGKVLYTYDGQWVADKRHGSGSCVRNHKEKYSGQWSQNFYHGAGTFVDEKGTLYEGEWRQGKFHGVGKHICRGETYTGAFEDGERHGMGQLVRGEDSTAQDFLGAESLYAGQWRAGQRHGQGTAIYAGGEYEGDWVHGKRHGQAVLSCKGFQLEGPWAEDLPDESGTHMVFYPDGGKYTGKIHLHPAVASTAASTGLGRLSTPWNIAPEGHGIMKEPDGRLYEGHFERGAPHGRGYALSLGSKYEGEFACGERHGSGWLQNSPNQREPTPVHYDRGELTPQPSEQAFLPAKGSSGLQEEGGGAEVREVAGATEETTSDQSSKMALPSIYACADVRQTMLTPTLLYDPFMHRTDFGSDSVFPTWVDVSHVRAILFTNLFPRRWLASAILFTNRLLEMQRNWRIARLRTAGAEESLRSEEQHLVLTAPPVVANQKLRLSIKVRMGLENAVSMQTAGSVRLPDDTGTCVASMHPFSTMRRPAARVAARHDLCLYSRVLAITNLGFGFTCCKVKYKMYKRAELGVSDVHRIGTPAPCEQQPLRRSSTSVVVAQRFCFSVRYCRDPMPVKRPEQHVHLGQTLSDMDVGLLEPLKVSAAAWRQGSGSSFEALRLRSPHVVDSKIFLAARPLPAASPSILLCSPGVNRRAATMGKIPVVLPNAPGQHVYLQTTSPSDTDVGCLFVLEINYCQWHEGPRSSSRSRGRDAVNAMFRDCLQDVMVGSRVEMEASWEECGLDSLSSIAFARRLSDAFDLSFDATTFFDFGSPALLAKSIWDRLHNMEPHVSPNPAPAHAGSSTFVRPLGLEGMVSQTRFFVEVSYFASWTRWLGDTCEVHVLGGAARCWDTQLDANVSYIQRTCDSRPFVIFGHSFGSIAAFELCSHLQELHFEMPGCLIVSGSPTPAMFEWKKDMAPFNYFDMEVKDAAGVRDVLCFFHVLDANMDVLTDDLLLADLSLVKSYMPRSDRKLACPIIGIHANDDVLVPSSRTVAAWSTYTTSAFTMHQIDGTHFFFFRPPAAFVVLLQSCLDGYEGSTWPGPGAYELETFWWGTLDLHTYPYGVNPKGHIIYTDGHVFVHLCDPLVDPAKPLAAAHSHTFYHGTYDIENGAVFHNIEMSNNPNDHADVLGRYFHWQEEGRKLTLSTQPDLMRAAGGTLIWQLPLKEPGDWSVPQRLS